MTTAVQKWGNSLALRIPRTCAAETNLSEGSEVELRVQSGTIVVRPIVRKRHKLNDLLQRVTARNRHGAVDTRKTVGNEVW